MKKILLFGLSVAMLASCGPTVRVKISGTKDGVTVETSQTVQDSTGVNVSVNPIVSKMVVYYVDWRIDPVLSKGTGRVTDDCIVSFSVLCRGIADATACLNLHFKYHYKGKYCIDDGVATFKRCKVDSRNFNPTYLFADGVRWPISLNNLEDSIVKYSNKFLRY